MSTQDTATTYDKVIALGCWIFPVLALLLLFVRSTPLFVRRHAQWALLLPILLIFLLTPLEAILSATVGFSFQVTAVATSVYALLALFNLLALVSGRGPWNRSLST